MEDDDDDNDASDRASFFSPMLSRQAAPRPRSVGPLRVAVGRSVRRSERRSAFPCFSYFMIPKREWERIDYNDGHQATTIEQKKVWLPMYATLPNHTREVLWCPKQTTLYVYSSSRLFPPFIAHLELLFSTEIPLYFWTFFFCCTLIRVSRLFGTLEQADGTYFDNANSAAAKGSSISVSFSRWPKPPKRGAESRPTSNIHLKRR